MITKADEGKAIIINPMLNRGFAQRGKLLVFSYEYPACYLVELDDKRIIKVYEEDGITLYH